MSIILLSHLLLLGSSLSPWVTCIRSFLRLRCASNSRTARRLMQQVFLCHVLMPRPILLHVAVEGSHAAVAVATPEAASVLVAVAAAIHTSQGINSHHASCVARRTTLFSSASSGSILPKWGMRDLPTPRPRMVLTPTGKQTSVQQIMSPRNSINLLCEMPITAPIKSSPLAVQVCVLNILVNLLFALHIVIFSLTTFFMFLNHLRTLLPFIV
jgi:hypothetical protein